MAKKENTTVALRPWEYAIYSAYDNLIYAVNKSFFWLRGWIVKVREWIDSHFEFYMAEDGCIRRRRSTGSGGVYRRINGKLVKVAHSMEVEGIDDFSIIPWQECNNGSYDEELGAYVQSKDHYRQLMKEKGLRPLESTNYCGSASYRQAQAVKSEFEKHKKQSEKNFIEALRRTEAQYGRFLD